MAKRGTKEPQARKRVVPDDSLLTRSAESLGRVIGTLEREVKDRSRRVSSIAGDAIDALPELPRFDGVLGAVMPGRKPRTRVAARKTATRKGKTSPKTAGGRKRAAARKTSKKR